MSTISNTINNKVDEFKEKLANKKLHATSSVDTSGLNDDYSELAKNNPYLNYNYERSIWDNIGNMFGFRTKEDAFREQMSMAASEYDAQLLSAQREEEYNNEINSANRMRAAGLNPDLQGLGQASEASEFNEPETHPTVPEGSEQEVQQFVSNMFSVLTTTMGFAKSFEDLKNLKIANDIKDAEATKEYMNLARDIILDQLPKEAYIPEGLTDDNIEAGGTRNNMEKIQEHLWGAVPFIAKQYGFNKRQMKRFNTAFTQVANSVPTTIEGYNNWRKLNDARTTVASQYASKYYSSEDKEMKDLLQAFINPMEQLNEQITKLNKTKTQKEQEYQEAADPTLQAEAENATNTETANREKLETEINAAFRNIVDNLTKKAENGNKLAEIGLVIINGIRLMTMAQKTPIIGGSKGYETVINGNPTYNRIVAE